MTRKLWTSLARRPIYDNRWISITEHDIVAPTGAPGIYGVVHYKNLAIGILPIDEEGCTILIGQERFVFGSYSWELPEGGGPLDQPPLKSAERELSEEAGLKADNWLELFGKVQLSNSVSDEEAFGFLAWGLAPDQSHAKDPSEELAVRRVPYAEVVRMAVSGEILD